MQRAEILKAALALPDDEREKLADQLWESLDGAATSEAEQAWADEIERRIDEADAGQAKTVPWSEVRAEAIEAVRQARGR